MAYEDNENGQSQRRQYDSSRYSDRSRYSSQRRQASQSRSSSPTQRSSQSRSATQARNSNQARSAGQSRNGSNPQRRQASQTRSNVNEQRSARSRHVSTTQYAEVQQYNSAQGYQDVSRYNDPSRYNASVGSYNSLYNPQQGTLNKKQSNAPKIILVVVLLAVIAALVWFFVIPKPFEVTVNGKEVTMNPGTTVASLVEEGYARPTPGNLVAVDGSIITAGEGEPFSATINGEKAATDAKLAKDMTVEIGNGGDITEDFTSSQETIPFDTVNDDTSFEAYWTGSIHEMRDGVDGLRTVKTGTISGKTVSEDTVPAIPGGYHNYTVQTDQPVIALTFDDGPWPETTDQILDILEANGAKATFFTIGEQVEPYSAAVKRAEAMGCEVCTHSWDHASGSGGGVDLTLMSADEQISEITQGYAAIANVLGKEPPHIIRAPGGNFHDDIINTLWSYVDAEIGWDVDTKDWSLPGSDSIASVILSVEPGQVVLMHDGGGDRAQTVAALREALPVLVERGYKCVTISELLTYDKSRNGSQAAPAEPAGETAQMEA